MFFCTHRPIGIVVMLCLAGSIGLFGQPATTLPFQLTDRLIVVEAEIQGLTGNYILDTGVEHLILNRRYFRGQAPAGRLAAPLGAVTQVRSRYVRLQLGGRTFRDVYAQVISLEKLEAAKGMIIHGLIGTRLLRDFEMLIDLSTEELTLFPIDRRGEHAYDYLTEPADTIAFRWRGPLIALEAQVGSETLQLALDTGAEIALFSQRKKETLAPLMQAQQRSTQVVGLGDRTEKPAVSALQHVQLGTWACAPLRIFFCSLRAYNRELPPPGIDGLAGYDLLSPYQWAINFRKREIYVWLDEPVYRGIIANVQAKARH